MTRTESVVYRAYIRWNTRRTRDGSSVGESSGRGQATRHSYQHEQGSKIDGTRRSRERLKQGQQQRSWKLGPRPSSEAQHEQGRIIGDMKRNRERHLRNRERHLQGQQQRIVESSGRGVATRIPISVSRGVTLTARDRKESVFYVGESSDRGHDKFRSA